MTDDVIVAPAPLYLYARFCLNREILTFISAGVAVAVAATSTSQSQATEATLSNRHGQWGHPQAALTSFFKIRIGHDPPALWESSSGAELRA